MLNSLQTTGALVTINVLTTVKEKKKKKKKKKKKMSLTSVRRLWAWTLQRRLHTFSISQLSKHSCVR